MTTLHNHPERTREAICPPFCAGHDSRMYQSWEPAVPSQNYPASRPHHALTEAHGGVSVSVGATELPDGLLPARVQVYVDDSAAEDMHPADAHALGLAIVRAGEAARRWNERQASSVTEGSSMRFVRPSWVTDEQWAAIDAAMCAHFAGAVQRMTEGDQ
ncbi:hypothetical protein KLP28_01715 [Nocardioidaceae bacterium]|nr:hypothetical protein KLP28_01715 [Nocardioidaceae bacterium]